MAVVLACPTFFFLAAGRKQRVLFKEKQLYEACEKSMHPVFSMLQFYDKCTSFEMIFTFLPIAFTLMLSFLSILCSLFYKNT